MDWDENICHCGGVAIVNEALGYSRGMCEDCDLTRCDAFPGECPVPRPWPEVVEYFRGMSNEDLQAGIRRRRGGK